MVSAPVHDLAEANVRLGFGRINFQGAAGAVLGFFQLPIETTVARDLGVHVAVHRYHRMGMGVGRVFVHGVLESGYGLSAIAPHDNGDSR